MLGLVRFIPESDRLSTLIGEPVDKNVDVGQAVRAGKPVDVNVFSGTSILNPGSQTGKTERVYSVLSPLAASEVGAIRCIGLNYRQHADEAKMAYPKVPVLF